MSGGYFGFCAARVTNYVNGIRTGVYRAVDTSQNGEAVNAAPRAGGAAAFITAQITDLVIRGITGSASQTLGADELHVYSRAAS